MNTHTFGNYSVTCPICQRTGGLKQLKVGNGLFTCPHCQEQLVVTWSGHYVRDPHKCKPIVIPHLIRRQSRPLARILRDFGNFQRPSLIVAFGSAILFGVSFIALENLNPKNQPFQELLDRVTEVTYPFQNPK